MVIEKFNIFWISSVVDGNVMIFAGPPTPNVVCFFKFSFSSIKVLDKPELKEIYDLEEYQFGKMKIPYHLIDIIELETDYSVYTFQKDFIKSYEQIIKGKKIPILCGGTGLYIESELNMYIT